MNIESYIEKDIIRKVKIAEYIFEHKTLVIRELAKELDVTFNTIKKDLSMLSVQLSPFLDHYELSATEVTMIFTKHTTRYDLIKEIYSESKFLKVVARYLLGDTNYLSIVDEEFVSVTKAFKIKKEVETYLKKENLLDSNNHIKPNELLYRLIFVSIWLRTDFFSEKINTDSFKRAEQFVAKVFDVFDVYYLPNDREYSFFLYHTYLCLERPDDNLVLTNYRKSRVNSSYNKLAEISDSVLAEYHLSDKNLKLLAIFCKLLILKSKNYSIVNMNYHLDRQEVIEDQPDIQQLIKTIETEFKIPLRNNMIFEVPFIYFIYSLWENAQNYFIERNYFLTVYQMGVADRLEKILRQWKEMYHPDEPIHFNKTAIIRLVSEIHSALLTNHMQKHLCMIVAENELSHIIYRESLKRWINPEFITMDDRMYYSADHIPIYKDDWPHFIIYERSLLTKEEHHLADSHLFYISRNSLLQDIKLIREYLYEKSLLIHQKKTT